MRRVFGSSVSAAPFRQGLTNPFPLFFPFLVQSTSTFVHSRIFWELNLSWWRDSNWLSVLFKRHSLLHVPFFLPFLAFPTKMFRKKNTPFEGLSWWGDGNWNYPFPNPCCSSFLFSFTLSYFCFVCNIHGTKQRLFPPIIFPFLSRPPLTLLLALCAPP